jgi:hypothetical protein
MHRVGIRGVHNFDANLFTPEVVEKPLVFMTDDWKDAFRFATNLTDSLGFELTIAGSPGWRVTGGPWVEPADAMKKFVWTETRLKGGQTINGVLPQPSDVSGNFVADALVYYGENTNITYEFTAALPAISGYEYDFVNSTALVEVVKTEGGKMITPGGGSYSVLVLHESAREMTLPVLRKIKELVDAGVAVTGTGLFPNWINIHETSRKFWCPTFVEDLEQMLALQINYLCFRH